MAEESGGESWWGAWGTELLSNVKAKSAETFSLVKQDLAEFVTTIQHDTTVTVAETANTVKEKLKVEEDETDGSTTAVIRQGVSHWLGSLSTALKENVTQMTAIVDEEPASTHPGPVFDRVQARVHEIQTDPATYCNDPDGHPAHYEDWCRGFDLEQHKADISELLVNKPEIRSLYTKLVPSAVTNSLFWTRYFYKMHRFHQEEKRKAALVERANKMDEEDIGWDDEEESWDIDETYLKDNKPAHHTQSEASDDTKPSTAATSQTNEPRLEKEIEKPNSHNVQSDSSEDRKKDLQVTTNEQFNEEKDDNKPTTKTLNTEAEQSSEIKAEDIVHISSDLSTLPSVTKEQTSLGGDGPRESSTPEPCPSEQQTVTTKHKRTTSNVSEGGKDDLQPENDSNSSVDSSWSKLSDEDLKQNNDKQTTLGPPDASRGKSGPSPSQSEFSSSSVVVVPAIDDDDLDWDDDDDDLTGDINKDDSKKADAQPADDDDDDDWENWE
ncbi:BSD domain-containing protein 1-A [Exaiptasia diaphana]|uniref:BSD domain-containing protein n=1 Tax=Exaiptasia diaphana TaxID=2652724 RepID=A0A913XTX3_EXADI|nr:BSD domain-containing protein 1-A [Exaiptasia diaphana]